MRTRPPVESEMAAVPKQSKWPLVVCLVIVLAVVAGQHDLWPVASSWAETILTWMLGLLVFYAPFHVLLGLRNGTIVVGERDDRFDRGGPDTNVDGSPMSGGVDVHGRPFGLPSD